MEVAGPPDGVIALLPAVAGAPWRWCAVTGGALGDERAWSPDEPAPWVAGTFATLLVPAAAAPVSDAPLPDLPVPQVLAAARIGAAKGELEADRHVAASTQDGRLLTAVASPADMDLWLAGAAAAGLVPKALVPAALVLPRPESGVVLTDLGDQPLARTGQAAFAAEPALLDMLGEGTPLVLAAADIEVALLALHAAPPLDLRQGRYAAPRVSFFTLPDWRGLARMAASAALLALVLMLVLIVRLDRDAAAREDVALEMVQQRFPSASDLDSAERLVAADAARHGQGAVGFAAPTAALLAAMRPVPGVSLRDIGFGEDGILRFTAAAPRAEEINLVLVALQRQGWKVTVPPALAPDPTGATVAAMTVRAP
ncbi:MAG: hypothetical protein IH997_12660 [Proteobacteria bacterium]|nr:hypothetical protein [Pseudomonadota bacterium]